MADRRSVRSSSRRITPTPQPPSIATTPQPGRATRRRGTRSASHEIEGAVPATKSARRNARQASSIASESDQEGQTTRRTRRKPQKEPIEDLTTVEEADTQIAIEVAAQTPPRPQEVTSMPHRSPGAVSEMSGTTAISSFSIVEAEMLEPKFIRRHLPKLYEISTEFLKHLVPDDARIEEDKRHMREIQMPDSDFTQDYRDYNAELAFRLSKFRTEHQQYIRLRAVRRALLGPDRDPSASQSGLDLILYLANLVIFAKQMIGSDRGEKEMFDALRELDRAQFPQIFVPALVSSAAGSPTGESALMKETLDLALELRTQLAIVVLERSSNDVDFNPDEVVGEVFFETENQDNGSILRGWDIPGLGGNGDVLSPDQQARVLAQLNKIRGYFPTDDESLERGETVDFDGLGAAFSWESIVIKLLQWVRLRHREIQTAIAGLGGIAAIDVLVKDEIEQTNTTSDRATSVPRVTPHKNRTSFGRDRRRSGRKFNPHDTSNDAGVLALLAREKELAEKPQAMPSHQVDEFQDTAQAPPDEQEELPPVPGGGINQEEQQAAELIIEEPSASGPPRSTGDYLKLFKDVQKSNKENRGRFFERQPNAQRIEFGDGFDGTQASPGPSRKGKEPQRPSPRKRYRPVVDIDTDEDDDAFETGQSNIRAMERRQKAPVAKKVRIDATSSAPPSHQPPARNADRDYDLEPEEQAESISEPEAPEMTEEVPTSSFAALRPLARLNARANTVVKGRKRPTAWTAEEEDAFQQYMEMFPQRYAAILDYDKRSEGYGLLQNRTQINLKDKARNMSAVMIKSGAGLKPGFENVLKPDSKLGRVLVEDGYEW